MKLLGGAVVATAVLMLVAGCGSDPQTPKGYERAVLAKYGHCLDASSLTYYPNDHAVGARGKPMRLFFEFKVSGDKDHTKVETKSYLSDCIRASR